VNRLELYYFGLRLAAADVIPDITNPPLDPLPLDSDLFFRLVFLSPLLEEFAIGTVEGVTTSLRVRPEPTNVPDPGSSLPLLGLSVAGLALVRRRLAR
jgi:hypothetical protein